MRQVVKECHRWLDFNTTGVEREPQYLVTGTAKKRSSIRKDRQAVHSIYPRRRRKGERKKKLYRRPVGGQPACQVLTGGSAGTFFGRSTFFLINRGITIPDDHRGRFLDGPNRLQKWLGNGVRRSWWLPHQCLQEKHHHRLDDTKSLRRLWGFERGKQSPTKLAVGSGCPLSRRIGQEQILEVEDRVHLADPFVLLSPDLLSELDGPPGAGSRIDSAWHRSPPQQSSCTTAILQGFGRIHHHPCQRGNNLWLCRPAVHR